MIKFQNEIRIAEASPDPQYSKEREQQHLHAKTYPDITDIFSNYLIYVQNVNLMRPNPFASPFP